jgi:tRNA A-37 threonylcarbamoyl transferase component Bud32/membrane-associated phospholipid phosphatase
LTSSPQTLSEPGSPASAVAPPVSGGRRRRRPSGEPPPLPRALHASGKWWLVLACAVVAVLVVVGTVNRAYLAVDVADHRVLVWLADLRTPWLTTTMKGLGVLATGRALQVLWLSNLVVLVIFRRWRHLFVWFGAGLLVSAIAGSAAQNILRPRPAGIEILGGWKDFAMPSLPMAMLAAFLVNTLYALVPAGRARETGKLVVAALLAITLFSRLYLAQEAPTDAILGLVIGVAVSLSAFRLFAPNEVFPVRYHRGRTAHVDVGGARHDAIVRALADQLGVIAAEVKPFGLAGSGGSTPLRVKVKGDPESHLFCKLYTATHLRSDRWYKLGRTLVYGRLEDEKPFNAVRRLVQYEDYVLRVMHADGLPVPAPHGIVEITPEREYLLVTEFVEGARELGDVDIDEALIDQGLVLVRRLWDAGLAHRDIKPANLLVRDGRLLLIDSAFGQVRPSPWRQAVDLGNMMLVLALRSDARQVHDRARRYFSDDEIAEAFASTRGLTMPSQLRHLMRQQGRDLHGEFLRLLPYQLPPVKIQRWSLRRVALTVGALVCLVLFGVIGAQFLTSPL